MSAEIEARKVERTAVDLVNRTTLDLLTRAVAHAKAHAISAALDKPFSRERPDPVDVFLDHTLLYLPDYYVDAHEFAKTAAELNATALECQVEFVKVDRLEGERRSSKEISAQSRKHESCFDGVVRVLEILDDQHSAIRNKMWEAIGAFNRSKTPPVVPNGPTERLR